MQLRPNGGVKYSELLRERLEPINNKIEFNSPDISGFYNKEYDIIEYDKDPFINYYMTKLEGNRLKEIFLMDGIYDDEYDDNDEDENGDEDEIEEDEENDEIDNGVDFFWPMKY